MDVKPSEPPSSAPRDELIRRGLRLSHLRLIVALQDTGQVSQAAAKLAMTQPSASRLLSELEHAVEARLYERHSRGVSLTPTGRMLATHALEVLDRLDRTHGELAAMRGGARGAVRIGSVACAAVDLVLPALRDVQTSHPEIDASVTVDTSDRLGDALLARDLDFYVGGVPDGADDRIMALGEVGVEPVSLIVRFDHPLSRRNRVGLADCLDYGWVMQPEAGLMRRAVETSLRRRGFPAPRVILTTTSVFLTLATVANTDAIAAIPRSAECLHAADRAVGGRLRRLDIAEDMEAAPFSLICRRDRDISPAVERVLGAVRRTAHGRAAARGLPGAGAS